MRVTRPHCSASMRSVRRNRRPLRCCLVSSINEPDAALGEDVHISQPSSPAPVHHARFGVFMSPYPCDGGPGLPLRVIPRPPRRCRSGSRLNEAMAFFRPTAVKTTCSRHGLVPRSGEIRADAAVDDSAPASRHPARRPVHAASRSSRCSSVHPRARFESPPPARRHHRKDCRAAPPARGPRRGRVRPDQSAYPHRVGCLRPSVNGPWRIRRT